MINESGHFRLNKLIPICILSRNFLTFSGITRVRHKEITCGKRHLTYRKHHSERQTLRQRSTLEFRDVRERDTTPANKAGNQDWSIWAPKVRTQIKHFGNFCYFLFICRFVRQVPVSQPGEDNSYRNSMTSSTSNGTRHHGEPVSSDDILPHKQMHLSLFDSGINAHLNLLKVMK